MNQTTKVTITLVAFGFIIGMMIWKGHSFELPSVNEAPAKKQVLASPNKMTPQFANQQVSPSNSQVGQKALDRKPSSTPKESLSNLTHLLSNAIKPEVGLKDLVHQLNKSEQQPLVVSDRNKYTGEMVTVRTKNPPPGTRYFHAQVMDDPNLPGKGFVQHIGFEFRKSPSAFKEAIQEVQRNFGVGEPHERYPHFVKWKLKDAYVVWIKEMDEDDLADNPFNAYSVEDKGTIRIVVEQDIHHEEG